MVKSLVSLTSRTIALSQYSRHPIEVKKPLPEEVLEEIESYVDYFRDKLCFCWGESCDGSCSSRLDMYQKSFYTKLNS